jgi:redox-sensitive bicupin YhaK (pirin superfamily)
MGYGPLRVFNDDTIQPGKGFDFHPHSNMEIITYLIDGELEHKDNFGNHGIIQPGEVQRMSAGTGIVHAEYNHSKEKPLRLLQMWVTPDAKDIKPSWEQRKFTKKEQQDVLLPVVVPQNHKDGHALKIHQDAAFYLSTLSAQKTILHQMMQGRMAYVFIINGEAEINGNKVKTQDAAMIADEKISITASEPTELIIIDLLEKFQKHQ